MIEKPSQGAARRPDYVDEVKARKKLGVYDQLIAFQNIKNMRVDEIRALLDRLNIVTVGVPDKEIMAICHYCRLRLNYVGDDLRRESENWLRFNQYPIPKATTKGEY